MKQTQLFVLTMMLVTTFVSATLSQEITQYSCGNLGFTTDVEEPSFVGDKTVSTVILDVGEKDIFVTFIHEDLSSYRLVYIKRTESTSRAIYGVNQSPSLVSVIAIGESFFKEDKETPFAEIITFTTSGSSVRKLLCQRR